MKTIESLDFPLRVYFKDGECHHDSAAIIITNGFHSFVRGRGPDVIYPWENVKHIIRVADEPAEPDLTERLRASVAAIAEERNGAKQDAMRLGTLLTSTVAKVSAALGRVAPDPRSPDTAVELANGVRDLLVEVVRLRQMHTEKRLALHKALGLNDNEDLDHAALCERLASLRWQASNSVAHVNETMEIADELKTTKADLASMTEQRDLLKRQLEELRAETRKPALPQPKQVEPGGPIWVRVADASSHYFGLVGRLNNITSIGAGDDVWEVHVIDRHKHGNTLRFKSESFVVVGTGRNSPPVPTFEEQVKACRELNPTDEPNPDNRDSYRGTALRAGAKDCTLFVGPKPTDLTFVVEMREGSKVFDVVAALEHEHGLQPEAYRIREVRPAFSGPNNGRD